MATVELPDAPQRAAPDEVSLLPDLAAAMLTHANKTERLIARMKQSVAQGDRMLAELGLVRA